MSQVILSPTWKLIPDTVSWPEKPTPEFISVGWPQATFETDSSKLANYHYLQALTEASRHLVDIAEEDWDRIKYYIPGIKPLITPIQSDTPYTIDAEFEVGWEIINQWDGDDIPVTTDPDAAWIDRRQIARLVKPKEDRCNGSKFCDCAKQAMTNGANRDWVDQTEDNCKFKPTPTDSVTSDGTKAKLKEELAIGEIRQIRLAALADNAEAQVIELKRLLYDIENEVGNGYSGVSDSFLPPALQNRISDALKKYPILNLQPTETQDELWEEVAQSIINHVQVMPELKKRFKIEMI